MRLALILALLPGGLAAHPHVFVDAIVEVLTEAGAVTGVRLVWTYDDFFSLMLTEDLGLDADGDLLLTPAEATTLANSVADWPPDFAGDLVVEAEGAPRSLSPREDHAVGFQGGKVVEMHRRSLAQPASATQAPVVVEVFDPYYYVAYAITDATVTGDPSCQVQIVPADLEAAQAEVDATWAGLDWSSASPDVQLPAIGGSFTDRIEVRCGA